MQEHNLNITFGMVNHSGEGFQVGFRKGKSEPQYMSACKFCDKNISLHIHQKILTGSADSFLCPKCGKMHNKAETISLAKCGRWVTPTCKFYIHNHDLYMLTEEITVRELVKHGFNGDGCYFERYSLYEIDTADSFDKRVKIKVKTNHLKPTAREIIERAFNETMEEMKPATNYWQLSDPTNPISEDAFEFKTMGIDPMKDMVNYKIVGWTKDKAHRELKTGFITGSIESESTKELLAKRINKSDISFAVIDESYHTKSVRDFAAQHKIKVATMILGNKRNQKDRYDSCFILASNAAGKVIKSNEKMTIEEWASKENQTKRKVEDSLIKNTSGFGIEINYFDVLKEIKKPNSAAIVGVSNDDGEFSLNLIDFVNAYFKEGLELCSSATKLENALTTLSKAKDTEDDYLITCAELAVEESRDEVAFWSEQFKLLHSVNKCE